MAFIILSNNKKVLVDSEDYEWLNLGTWHEHSGGYAYGWHPEVCKPKQKVYMHRVLLPEAKRVDHINRVKLDNRKVNLRDCTQRQNTWNSVGSKNGTSKAKGVSWNAKRKRWVAQIRIFGKQKFLGRFVHEYEAERAYEVSAERFQREFQCKP